MATPIATPLVTIGIACLLPVPWSPPRVYMKDRKGGGPRYKSAARNPELAFWQAYVRCHAESAMGDRAPVLGPVAAALTFFRATTDPDRVGRLWVPAVAWRDGKNGKAGEYVKLGETVPDVDNLTKATLDALQGVVFGNDVQVCILEADRRYAPADGCTIRIARLDERDET